MSSLAVHHFGPDPATVGGMATVIRVLTENRVGADFVDCHPTWQPAAPLATTRLVAASMRVVLGMPRGEVAHVHLSERGSFLREGALVGLARRCGLATVVTLHGASFIPFARRHRRLVSAVLRRADLVICMDQQTLDLVSAAAPGVRSALVPNPVVVDADFQPADATDELVVFAGEVGLRKGADVLCRAWELVARRRPAARCLMVGPITDFRPPALERLEIWAPVGPGEMKQILGRARVVALPSRAEAMPMVLTEAMSLGRPFVSTPVGGIPELACEGGMLVPVGDAIGLAERLVDLLANPARARAIGERGRRFCEQTRSVDVVDARMRELYTAAAAK